MRLHLNPACACERANVLPPKPATIAFALGKRSLSRSVKFHTTRATLHGNITMPRPEVSQSQLPTLPHKLFQLFKASLRSPSHLRPFGLLMTGLLHSQHPRARSHKAALLGSMGSHVLYTPPSSVLPCGKAPFFVSRILDLHSLLVWLQKSSLARSKVGLAIDAS